MSAALQSIWVNLIKVCEALKYYSKILKSIFNIFVLWKKIRIIHRLQDDKFVWSIDYTVVGSTNFFPLTCIVVRWRQESHGDKQN